MGSLLESIASNAKIEPEKLCIADYNRKKYTNLEYWKLINCIAYLFKKLGLKKGDYVIVESQQSGLFTATAFANNK